MFYSYLFLRKNGSPYYIGKGCGNRAYSNNRVIKGPKDRNRIIVFPMLSEAEAFESEIALIDLFGRKDNGTGILRNLTDGGEGVSGHIPSEKARRIASAVHRGKIVSEQTRQKMRETRRNTIYGPFSQEHRHKLIEAGRRGGLKSKENGTGLFRLTKEERQSLGRKQGLRNVQNGQIQALGRKWGREWWAGRDFETRRARAVVMAAALSHEDRVRNGSSGGKKRVAMVGGKALAAQLRSNLTADRASEIGQLGAKALHAKLGRDGLVAAGRKGGLIRAKQYVKGIDPFGHTHEQHQNTGRIGAHLYWHVKRDIVNPKCILCINKNKG